MHVLGLAIRYGLPNEADAIAELVNTDEFPRQTSTRDIARMFSQGSFLVLDRDDPDAGGLAGSAFLQINNGRGELTLLSVAGDIDAPDLPQRFIEVAEMMCVAEGCKAMELKVIERPQLDAVQRELGFEPLHGNATRRDEALRLAKRL